MTEKDTIEDKINSKVRQRDKLIIELNNLQDEIIKLIELSYEKDPTKIKIRCVACRGTGYIISEDKKKRICQTCKGTQYNWAEIYEEKKN